MPSSQPEPLLDTLKRAAAALRDGGVPFALAGGVAVWARGGPPSEKDIDLFVRAQDRERARACLQSAGFRTEEPPEGWLLKAWDGEVLVDVIFEPMGYVVDDDLLTRCEELRVRAVPMLVLPAEDVLVSRLLALTEHHLDYGPLLLISRALREQINWTTVRERTSSSPFARAFLVLVADLGIAIDDSPPLDLDGNPSRSGADTPTTNDSMPLEHLLLHLRTELACDGRVGELGLMVDAEPSDDGPVLVVVSGPVSTPQRKAGIVPLVEEVLARHGVEARVDDRTTVAEAPAPDGASERP